MDLGEYFKNAKGRGVLATADHQGRVDVAVYAKPHVLDEVAERVKGKIVSDNKNHFVLSSHNGF